MAPVQITNVIIQQKIGGFQDPFKLEITLEANQPLQSDVQFKLMYLYDATYEAVLDEVDVQIVQTGSMRFSLDSNAPALNIFKSGNQVMSMGALVLAVYYIGQQFCQVGYYVRNQYENQDLQEQYEMQPNYHQIQLNELKRDILVDHPIVTNFEIDWNKNHQEEQQIRDEFYQKAQQQKQNIQFGNMFGNENMSKAMDLFKNQQQQPQFGFS